MFDIGVMFDYKRMKSIDLYILFFSLENCFVFIDIKDNCPQITGLLSYNHYSLGFTRGPVIIIGPSLPLQIFGTLLQ